VITVEEEEQDEDKCSNEVREFEPFVAYRPVR
jgi:hypothetical protein